jgi:tetratricopeptide (TPR) repeat protein
MESRSDGVDAEALVSKAVALAHEGRLDDALATYDEVCVRFGERSEPAIQLQVMRALYGKAWELRQSGRSAEALEPLQSLLNPYQEQDPPPGTAELLADALLIAAYAAYDVGDTSASMRLCDEIVRRFGDEEAVEIRATVADAITDKANTLASQGRHGDAVAVYDELLTAIGSAEEIELREREAEGLCNRGDALREAGDEKQAATSYREVTMRFREGESSYLDDRVRRARQALDARHS